DRRVDRFPAALMRRPYSTAEHAESAEPGGARRARRAPLTKTTVTNATRTAAVAVAPGVFLSVTAGLASRGRTPPVPTVRGYPLLLVAFADPRGLRDSVDSVDC